VKWKIVWAASVWEVFDELSEAERNEIPEHLKYVKRFPLMYPARTPGSRFRRHRWFLAGNWLVYLPRREKHRLYPGPLARPNSLNMTFLFVGWPQIIPLEAPHTKLL